MDEQLLLSKRLFIFGSDHCEKNDPVSAGMAISLFQDSIEIFLWGLLKHLDGQAKESTPFTQFFELVEKAPRNKQKKSLPFKAKILELNKARINFKHYGILPDVSEAKKFRTYTEEFLIQSSIDFLGENIFDVSLTKLVSFPDVREQLICGETHLKKGEIDECINELAKARYFLFRHVGRFLPEVDHHLTAGDTYLSKLSSGIRRASFFKYIFDYLSRLRESNIVLACGILLEDYMYLNRVLPGAIQSRSGKWFIRGSSSVSVTKEQAQRALELLINMAMKISSVLG